MSNKQVALITLLGGLAFVLLLYSILMTIMCDDLVRNISECCRGKRKTAGGYIWRYVDEERTF